MVIIALECLYEIKMYDFTVLNPVNFVMATMCEFALQYFPDSQQINAKLIKIYSKLGLVSLVGGLSEIFKDP